MVETAGRADASGASVPDGTGHVAPLPTLDPMAARLTDLARRKTEVLAPAGEAAIVAQHDRGKLTARERIDYLLDDGSFDEVGSLVRHHAFDSGLDGAPALHRRRGHRLRDHRRPAGLRLLPGLHRSRGVARRGARREDPPHPGPRAADGRPAHRDLRRRWRPHPGRRRRPARLRRHLPPQRRAHRASSPSSRSCSVRRPEARCTRRRSRTSSSWCRARATCSSPGPTSSAR